MEANKKRKIIIWSSVLTILGVGGYFGYKWLKDNGKIGKKKPKDTDTPNSDDTPPNTVIVNNSGGGSSSGGSSSGGGGGSSVTAEQKALATAYRIWANSTDELNKAWGKKSKYKLDASTTVPYNSFFLKSYNGGGKALYDASVASAQTGSTDNQLSAINNITAIAAKYKTPLLSHSTFGNYIQLFVAAERAGKKASFKLFVSTKDSNGSPQPDGKLVFMTQEGTYTYYSSYNPLDYAEDDYKYLIHTKKFKDETYSKTLNSGHITIKDGLFGGKTLWGIGKGSVMAKEKFITSFFIAASGNQIYNVFNYGTVTDSTK
jgi:hypothetical protein